MKTNIKIGTVTVHHAHNFGAMLQAYALQRALIKCGFETELIDYDEIRSTLFPRIKDKTLKGVVSWLFFSLKSLFKMRDIRMGYKRFEQFYDRFLLKSRKYKRLEEITTERYDVVLVGSDQVWNFKRDGNRPYFQLDFVSNSICASYAASMGSFFNLSENVRENFKKSLENFQVISVREKETAEYISRLTGKKCHLDVDPVFLLNENDWKELRNSAHKYDIPTDYILCYELLKSDELLECTNKLKNDTGLPVVVLTPSIYYKMKGDYIILDAGPCEMVSLIKNARFVVTNSYHGVVYSIIFQKLFWAILTIHGPGRIKELLEQTGLTSRIYSTQSDVTSELLYEEVNVYIEKVQKESEGFLKELKDYIV